VKSTREQWDENADFLKSMADDYEAEEPPQYEAYYEKDPTLDPISIEALLELDIPERQVIIGAIKENELALFVGQTGVGKSFFAHEIAGSVGAGVSMFEGHWVCPARRKVLLIDGEMMMDEIKAIASAIKYRGSYDILVNSWLETQDIHLDFAASYWWQELDRLSQLYDMMIMDNFYSLFPTRPDLPSSSAEFWTHMQPLLRGLRQNCAVIIFDHEALHKEGRGTASGTKDKSKTMSLVGILEKQPDTANPMGLPMFNLNFKSGSGGKVRGKYELCHDVGQVMFEGGSFKRQFK